MIAQKPDGTLLYEHMDHSYGGPESKGVGDPLAVIQQIAQQIAAKGIKRIEGRVLVDVSLFPEGERELGTNVVISPIVVNDNVVDVIVSPGDKEGAPVNLQVSPKTAYVEIVNRATTGKAGSKETLNYTDEKLNPNGTRTVTLSGEFPLGKPPEMASYAVPEPSRFAAMVVADAPAGAAGGTGVSTTGRAGAGAELESTPTTPDSTGVFAVGAALGASVTTGGATPGAGVAGVSVAGCVAPSVTVFCLPSSKITRSCSPAGAGAAPVAGAGFSAAS